MKILSFRMTRLVWQIRLRLERLVEVLRWEHDLTDLKAGSAVKGGTFDSFVDRVSPWVSYRGYRRPRLRRWLYRLRYARRNLVQSMRQLAINALADYRKWPGRYEGDNSHLIARWLDEHSEYADDHGGDSDLGGHYMIFGGGMPWGDYAYVTAEDSQGFFAYQEFSSYEDAFRDFAAAIDQPQTYGEDPSYGPSFFDDNEIVRANSLSESEMRFMHGDK